LLLLGLATLVAANKRSDHHSDHHSHHDDDDHHSHHHDDDDDDGRPTIVLVHGAFQDATGFGPLADELSKHHGYRVIAQSFPGRPANPNPSTAGVTATNPTLATYVAQVQSLIEGLKGRVVLVGHSFGGITISQVAENIPDKIFALVYLSAYLPLTGDTANGLSTANDHNSNLGNPNVCPLLFAPAPGSSFVALSALTAAPVLFQPCPGTSFASLFCPDCPASLVPAVVASEVPEPLGPPNTPVTLTLGNFGSVRKYYITTLQDQALSPQFQSFLISRQHVDKVFAVDAGHLSFLTQPEKIAKFIDESAHHAHRAGEDDDE